MYSPGLQKSFGNQQVILLGSRTELDNFFKRIYDCNPKQIDDLLLAKKRGDDCYPLQRRLNLTRNMSNCH